MLCRRCQLSSGDRFSGICRLKILTNWNQIKHNNDYGRKIKTYANMRCNRFRSLVSPIWWRRRFSVSYTSFQFLFSITSTFYETHNFWRSSQGGLWPTHSSSQLSMLSKFGEHWCKLKFCQSLLLIMFRLIFFGCVNWTPWPPNKLIKELIIIITSKKRYYAFKFNMFCVLFYWPRVVSQFDFLTPLDPRCYAMNTSHIKCR